MPGPSVPLIPPRPAPAATRHFSWHGRKARSVAYQVLAVLAIALLGWLLVSNTLANMRLRGIQSGFDFLWQPAGFDIGEGWLSYDSASPYWKAFLVGIVNTLRVALIGCVLATVLGTLLGVARFSRNALLRALSYGYVELFRNIPLLLQLLMWYLLFIEYLPPSNEALNIGKAIFLSKNGLSFPSLTWEHGQLQFQLPVAGEMQVEGGSALSPEFMAVLLGLVLYTSAFIAEVVRAGIASVPKGQHEAGASIGLSRARSMRLIVLPQALRLIIPPLTNQYLNLTKNSSLAVAVGYPELVSIANTSLNQSGRAVECIAIIMLVYLLLSLFTSALMNWFNRRAAIKER
ncbi:amino acid ABC transporter permease [Polaromonas sp.]|uniref:amino acid ABC transporter permease n=1 Tax=Polaromonas sp. TaxID=1869339 RepID=UPI003BAA6A56